MPALVRTAATPVWFGLMAATALSWWLGAENGVDDRTLATIVVLAVAFVKVRFVGMYFMELRHAPLPLRLAFEGWCLLIGSVVIVMYLARG